MPDRSPLKRVWDRVSDWIVVVAVAAGILLAVYSFWTIHQTHQIVVNHDTELAETKAIAQDLLHNSQVQTTNHEATLHYLVAICDSTPGCPQAVARMAP